MAPLVFEKATVLCYRIFDVANEIDLERLGRELMAGTRVRFTREGSEFVQLLNPPVSLSLGTRFLPLRDGPVEVEARARFYDHGAVSIILEVPVPVGLPVEQMVILADELFDSRAVDSLCLELVESIRKSESKAFEDSHLWEQNEGYTVLLVEKLAGNPSAQEVITNPDLPRLLLGESKVHALSPRERLDVLQMQFSYSETDLVIVDWNSAFVYEPSGSRDIPDILEICNAQLLEFRYYDDLLGKSIKRTYDALQSRSRGWGGGLLRSPYRGLFRRVQVTLLEMDEFIERAENSLKIIGDFYLARVYEGAVARLRLANWQAAVTRKQQILGNVYQLLKGEVDTARSLTLESVVVVLIVGELLLALLSVWKH